MKRKFTFLFLLTVCLIYVNAQTTMVIPATFNGTAGSDWLTSDNWTVNYTDTVYNYGSFTSWEDPYVAYWTVSDTAYAYVAPTIPSGYYCVFNDAENTTNYSGGDWYKRLAYLVVEEGATLDFAYRTDSVEVSEVWYNYDFYVNGAVTINGTMNFNGGNFNGRNNIYVDNGTIVVNDGSIYSKYYTKLGTTYVAGVAATDSTDAVEEVNNFGRIIFNGGYASFASPGIAIANHYEGNMEPAVQINGGIYEGSIRSLNGSDGWTPTRAGEIEINNDGELRLTGYSLNDLYDCFKDSIITSRNGTKVPVDDPEEASTRQLIAAQGLNFSVDGDVITLTANWTEDDGRYTATAIEETIEEAKTMNVYPNPSNDGLFYVDASDYNTTMKVTVYSATGSMVFAQNYEAGSVVNVSTGLSAGFYLMKIETEGDVITKKVYIK